MQNGYSYHSCPALIMIALLFILGLNLAQGVRKCPVLNEESQICCDGIPQSKVLGSECCGRRAYRPEVQQCCTEGIVAPSPLSCCGTFIYNPMVQQCCNNFPAPLGPPINRFQCCGRHSLNERAYQCCEETVQPKGIPSIPLVCCGRYFYNPKTQACVGNRVKRLKNEELNIGIGPDVGIRVPLDEERKDNKDEQ